MGEEAESCLNSFRSQQRVFAAAAESKSREVNEVEREVVVRKNVTNVSTSSANVSRTAIQTSCSRAAEASSSSSLQQQQSSSSAAMAASSSSRNYRAGQAQCSAHNIRLGGTSHITSPPSCQALC